ncbi:MAG: ribose-phosphate pyrophosphokinase [Oscillospiraceae bacterium]|jgi:ribose-phosphate pyrophosphokinase|nr:ribose-phosphate pyrophosphokinase [Oscillospiraceae bacterium]
MALESITHGHLGVVGQRGSEELTGKVDAYLRQWDIGNGGTGKSVILQSECPRFSTGEGKGVLLQSIRGYDLYIISDLFNYGVTYKMYGKTVPMSPDDHYQDLKRIIMATNGKARRVTVIMTMLYEGRQHRRTSRESMDCAMALQELAGMGVENIITFDAHDARVQNAIPLCGFENVTPSHQMISALLRTVPDIEIEPSKLVVVSPDEGSMPRCIYYASVLELDLGMFYKRRDYAHIKDGRNPIISHEFLGDGIEGKDVIVADDMISTGDSFLSICEDLKARGARRIFFFATFGLFTEGVEAFDKAYERGMFERVFTTNLIYRPDYLKKCPWYTEVDMSKYIAYIIDTLNHDESISHLLDPVQRTRKKLAEHAKGE